MYQYLKDIMTGLDREDMIVRVVDKACIPNDPMNRDWVKFQEWLGEDNTPEASE